MAEFEEKLNALLSNPDAMAQIMQMAQSLSGGGAGAATAPPFPPQTQPTATPPPVGPAFSPPVSSPVSAPSPPAADPLSLLSSIDPSSIARFLPLIQELGSSQDSQAKQLLFALRPYLRQERQEKVERALQLAKLFHLGRKFLSEWGGL